MLKGSALIYAIFLALIIAMITSSFLLLNYYRDTEILNYKFRNALNDRCMDAMATILSNNAEINYNQFNQLKISEKENENVDIMLKKWGNFEVAEVVSTWNNFKKNKIAMLGIRLDELSPIALYLCDKNKPLSLGGKTKIKGNCFLPKSGVKRAYVEGQNFQGNSLVEGAVQISSGQLPPLNENLLSNNRTYLQGQTSEMDSLVDYQLFLSTADSVNHSFHYNTLYLFSTASIEIRNITIKGNVVIYSPHSVIIDESANLKDVLIYSPKVIVRDNFRGAVQVFASDSLQVGLNCQLDYPSALSLIKSNSKEGQYEIMVGANSKIYGSILIHDYKPMRRSKALLKIDRKAMITGQIYSNGAVYHEGSVIGSIYCTQFTLRTPSSLYDNLLLNATIDRSKLSKYYVGIPLLEPGKTKSIVQWLM